MSVPPVTTIPMLRQARLHHVGGAAAVALDVPGSNYYTCFTFQVTGFTLGLELKVYGSFAGVWSPLNATNYVIPTITASADGIIFSIELLAPLPGGLRIVAAASAADGAVFVQMTGSLSIASR
jgi:hypothetical protein